MYKLFLKQVPQFLCFFTPCIFSCFVYGQQYPPNPLGGSPAPVAHTRTNDVVWLRTTWQRIDLRQKMNHPLYFPIRPSQGFNSLFGHITQALQSDPDFQVYSTGPLGDDDMLTQVLTPSEVKLLLSSVDTIWTPSLYEDNLMVPEIVVQMIQSEQVLAFDVKEAWYIDVQRSVMSVKIIAIAPVIAVYEPETVEFKGMKRLFWIDFETFRKASAKWFVRDFSNELGYLTYDDLFTQRKFSGTLIKVSSVYDRAFVEYLPPIDALLQATHEWENIRNIELDMWNY